MRLALVTSLLTADTRGGAEVYAEEAARALAERHDVVVLTGSSQPSVDGIRTVRVPRLPILRPGTPLAGRVLWHAFDQWLPHVHAAVVRELREVAPDLVLTHHPQGLSAAVFTAVAQLRIPHVHTAHDLNLLCARMTMTRDGEFCGGRCAGCLVQRRIRTGALKLNVARLVCVSRYLCERHVRAGVVPRERAHPLRLGALPGTSRQRRLNGRPTLGFIGSLSAHKGVRTLLGMFRQLEDPWRLVIAGDGPLAPSVAEAARVDERIEWLGHVSGDSKDAFFDMLDLVVIPSEWEEPATFVAAEAAVRGIPAIVSERGGLPETPEARTFRAGDREELTRAVRWFVDEPVRLEEASARLLAQREEFEWSTHVARLEKLLETVVAETS